MITEKLLNDWWIAGSALVLLIGVWVSRLRSVIEISRKIYKIAILFLTFPLIMEKRLNAQDVKLATIEKEVTPNGGGSLKDIVKSTNDLALVSDLRTKQMIVVHPTAMYECEPIQGKCTNANITLCELFGLDEPRMLGNGWLTAIDPHHRQECWDGYQAAILSDIPYSWEYTIINQRTGESIACKTEMNVLRDKKGKPLLFQGFVERKK
jgi:PAS domain S-box-containing protein